MRLLYVSAPAAAAAGRGWREHRAPGASAVHGAAGGARRVRPRQSAPAASYASNGWHGRDAHRARRAGPDSAWVTAPPRPPSWKLRFAGRPSADGRYRWTGPWPVVVVNGRPWRPDGDRRRERVRTSIRGVLLVSSARLSIPILSSPLSPPWLGPPRADSGRRGWTGRSMVRLRREPDGTRASASLASLPHAHAGTAPAFTSEPPERGA